MKVVALPGLFSYLFLWIKIYKAELNCVGRTSFMTIVHSEKQTSTDMWGIKCETENEFSEF